jgi:hypothetical protein
MSWPRHRRRFPSGKPQASPDQRVGRLKRLYSEACGLEAGDGFEGGCDQRGGPRLRDGEALQPRPRRRRSAIRASRAGCGGSGCVFWAGLQAGTCGPFAALTTRTSWLRRACKLQGVICILPRRNVRRQSAEPIVFSSPSGRSGGRTDPFRIRSKRTQFWVATVAVAFAGAGGLIP